MITKNNLAKIGYNCFNGSAIFGSFEYEYILSEQALYCINDGFGEPQFIGRFTEIDQLIDWLLEYAPDDVNPIISKAPFTDNEVAAINVSQKSNYNHPFTCCSPDDVTECHRKLRTSEGIMIATNEGLICPCGNNKQDWVYYGMTKTKN